MKTEPRPAPRKRLEADRFRRAVLALRHELRWSQARFAAKVGVSPRTLSSWECAHGLPPFKQRVHVVLALHDMPPEHVLAIADGLGVSLHPGVAPLLQPYRDALRAETEPDALAAPEPPRPRPTPEALRAVMDGVVRDAADAMNIAANDLRAVIGRALAACDGLGGTLEDAQGAVAVRAAKGAAGAKRG